MTPARRAPFTAAVGALALVAGATAACGACGKGRDADPSAATAASAARVNRVEAPPDAAPAIVRNVSMWAAAREGGAEELASLASHEGAAGLVEAAAEPELRPTALRAMAYARGWAQLPLLAKTAAGADDELSRLALASAVELAARPRRSEDVEDVAELGEGCTELVALARDPKRDRERRIGALRALRMMPCPKAELPTDLDAK